MPADRTPRGWARGAASPDVSSRSRSACTPPARCSRAPRTPPGVARTAPEFPSGTARRPSAAARGFASGLREPQGKGREGFGDRLHAREADGVAVLHGLNGHYAALENAVDGSCREHSLGAWFGRHLAAASHQVQRQSWDVEAGGGGPAPGRQTLPVKQGDEEPGNAPQKIP